MQEVRLKDGGKRMNRGYTMFKVLCSRKLTVTLLELEQYLQGIVAISKATNVQQLQTLYAHGY